MDESSSTLAEPFIARLALRNYKSIGSCDVLLNRLSIFVGPNGAGKSNILDSLRFVRDSLHHSMGEAVAARGGFGAIRRNAKGHPSAMEIALTINLPLGGRGAYAFRMVRSGLHGFAVRDELCRVVDPARHVDMHYRIAKGKLVSASPVLHAAVEPDRLYLTPVSAISEFRPLYDALTRMSFYNVDPGQIREFQDPDDGEVLKKDGSNVASVLARLEATDPEAALRLQEYLCAIVPGCGGVHARQIGPKQTVEFLQEVNGPQKPLRFLPVNMSDGTLRALGILVALFQARPGSRKSIPLVAIEEPETALHPAATSALADAVLETSIRAQVLLTSHSPEFLDKSEIESENLLAVVSEKGQTIVGPIDDACRKVLRERLFTPGELLRIQQFTPQQAAFRSANKQVDLLQDRKHESHASLHR